MDSLTHAALGACLGDLLLSKKLGKRALLWGAVAANLPDLDVAAALWLEPYQNLLVHRGATHSLLFALVAALLLSALAHRWYKDRQISWGQFFLFFLVQLVVHDLVDTCTAYGTGLLEPFQHHRFSFHLLYVADPFFSLGSAVALVALLWLKDTHPARWRWAVAGLVLPALYLGYAVSNQIQVREKVIASLEKQKLPYSGFFVTPTPLNNWLWYVVAQAEAGYYVGHVSVFSPPELTTKFQYFPQNKTLLTSAPDQQEVQELQKFARGYYTVERRNDSLVFNVLRYGQIMGWQNPRNPFTFHYYLYPQGIDNKLVMQRGRLRGWNQEALKAMFKMILVGREKKP
ncbi:metal-dependent hydrolase [Rufibacter glacialis]|uniref:Metal-dependent hydrolase n=1 Tax=Rufibacter glacialis TaxID=1259555 RepID=A0A5M8QC06_9BACT|nr:metal-dependent hydrolase [Rufibacter glacialis]KAA6433537.1 metal-dependent hydrolase [Rufibacter glacialis]GGK73251.1 membrane protein [Rufibacter glacialis]